MKWALVLSGGGAAGLAYIGFLKALEELHFPPPNCIIGCSIGAIIGGLYALGVPVGEMEDIFKHSFDVHHYVGNVRFPLFKNTVSPLIRYGTMLTRMISGTGADSGEKLYKLFFDLSKGKSFEDCRIPFYCNALDLCSGQEVIFNSGLLADAMRASSSYPGVFIPVRRNNSMLIDACIVDNTPVRIARKKGYKQVLALMLGSFTPVDAAELTSSLAVLIRTLSCTTAHITPSRNDYPTAMIDLQNNRLPYDFAKPYRQIVSGYKKTLESTALLECFFSTGVSGLIKRYQLTQQTRKEFIL